jgi:hypothetical protein
MSHFVNAFGNEIVTQAGSWLVSTLFLNSDIAERETAIPGLVYLFGGRHDAEHQVLASFLGERGQKSIWSINWVFYFVMDVVINGRK